MISGEPSPYYTDASSSVWYEYRPDGVGYIQIWFRPEFNGFVQAFSLSVFSELEPSVNALEYRSWQSCFLDYNCYQVLVDPRVVVFLQVCSLVALKLLSYALRVKLRSRGSLSSLSA